MRFRNPSGLRSDSDGRDVGGIIGAALAAEHGGTRDKRIGPLPSMLRIRAIFSSCESRNDWPPKPGLTVITSTRSRRSSTYSIALSGVAGHRLRPAFLPSARVA